MKVVYIRDNGGGCYHRIIKPLTALNSEEFDLVEILHEKSFLSEIWSHKPDILIYHNTCHLTVQEMMLLQSKGVKIIFSIDDVFDLEKGDVLIYPEYAKRYKTAMQLQIQVADLVLVTTESLAAQVEPFAKRVFISENDLPFDNYPKIPSNRLRLGLVGADGHINDYKVIGELMKLISKKPALYLNVEFHICGVSKENQSQFNSLTANKVKVIKHGWFSSDEYLKHYRNIDVLLCPLTKNVKNVCKSSLKLIEACVTDTIPLGSSLYRYKEVNCLLTADTAKEYLEHIKILLSKKKRSEILNFIQGENRPKIDFNKRVEAYAEMLKEVGQLKTTQDLPETLKMYSIYFDESQIVEYEPVFNQTKEKAWRFEYNPIIKVVDSLDIPGDYHVGIVSHKFPYKTNLFKNRLIELYEEHMKLVPLSSLTVPIWKTATEYLDFSYKAHPGLENRLKDLLKHLGKKYEYSEDFIVYANQFIMTFDLWKKYINEWIKPALEYMEGEAWDIYNQNANYEGGLPAHVLEKYTGLTYYNFVTFVLERLILFFVKQEILEK